MLTSVWLTITTDNPNVWFELGYALASGKEVCLICADERVERYPFDVQHRLILKYSCESRSDFDELKDKICERLKAILSKRQKLEKISSANPLKDTEGLSQHEIIALCTIIENRSGPNSSVSLDRIIEDMKALGYNKLAGNVGLEKLLRKDMIEITSEEGWDDWQKVTYNYEAYRVTQVGFEWLLGNENKLNLKLEELTKQSADDLDDDIPF